ncbi:MAG: HupU protein [Gammaproteobacteria bacterium]|nr:HupU protein [Gammaproteobacteria bacterium]
MTTLLWLQSGGCGGCTLSLLGAESPHLWQRLAAAGIELLWHPSLSDGGAQTLPQLLQQLIAGERPLDLLCIEGAVVNGPRGSGRFHLLGGSKRPMRDWIADLAPIAGSVVAIGSCSAFGGIPAAGGNPAEVSGLGWQGEAAGGLLHEGFLSRSGLPVINIAGCPTHPDWISVTLQQLAEGTLTRGDLDSLNRPCSYSDHLVHHGCPRNEYYEYKASALDHAELGCLMENLGCLGTQASADCNLRLWNGTGSCLRGGYACINCTSPGFEAPGHPFLQTAKISGIPVGLPIDMPKAWFVALASLAKAATPRRLSKNARSDHIMIKPERSGE